MTSSDYVKEGTLLKFSSKYTKTEPRLFCLNAKEKVVSYFKLKDKVSSGFETPHLHLQESVVETARHLLRACAATIHTYVLLCRRKRSLQATSSSTMAECSAIRPAFTSAFAELATTSQRGFACRIKLATFSV